MKHLRQLCATVTLICAFAFSAYAGDIECDATSPSPEIAGHIDCGLTIAENLIASVLALF
jgi:hypothetical protein